MNDRQRRILSILYGADGYITVKEMADRVGFSVKTIRNDLTVLKDFLEEHGLGTIVLKSNKGVCIEITKEDWTLLNHLIKKKTDVKTFSEDAKKQICEILLKQAQIQMKQLEELLFTGHSGIEKLVAQAQTWLKAQGIELLRKRGQGIGIQCGEYQYRIAMWKIFREIQAESAIFAEWDNRQQVERFLDGFDSEGVHQAIRQAEMLGGLRFSFDAYQRLLFLLSVSMTNYRRGKRVEIPVAGQQRENGFDRMLAEKCREILERYYQVMLDEKEREFLLLVTGISEIQEFCEASRKEDWENENLEIILLTEKIRNLCEHIFQCDFSEDPILKDNLCLYLKAAICQIQHGIHHENPFLEQIRYKYPNIYVAAWSVSLLVESEVQVEFGEHEVAYLALFLGGALERLAVNIQTCILCNYGMGISHILREQILRKIPNLDITDIVTTRDLSRIRKSSCDFIISAVPVESPYEGKAVIQIENILQERDVRNIKVKMKEVHKTRIRRLAGNYEKTAYPLFQPSFVLELEEEADKEAALIRLCRELFESGYVTKDFEASVLERERITSTALDKKVAIPHGNARYVLRPVIVVARLKTPVMWDMENEAELIFLLALNMREEFGARKQIVNFYSNLVTWLEEQDGFGELNLHHGAVETALFLNTLIAGGVD